MSGEYHVSAARDYPVALCIFNYEALGIDWPVCGDKTTRYGLKRTPRRVQRKRTKGWRMPENTVYVGRGSKWGNPYRALKGHVFGPSRPREGGDLVMYSSHAPATEAVRVVIENYRQDIDCAIRSDITSEEIRTKLAGKNLACWCPLDQPCHADVLLELANSGQAD